MDDITSELFSSPIDDKRHNDVFTSQSQSSNSPNQSQSSTKDSIPEGSPSADDSSREEVDKLQPVMDEQTPTSTGIQGTPC